MCHLGGGNVWRGRSGGDRARTDRRARAGRGYARPGRRYPRDSGDGNSRYCGSRNRNTNGPFNGHFGGRRSDLSVTGLSAPSAKPVFSTAAWNVYASAVIRSRLDFFINATLRKMAWDGHAVAMLRAILSGTSRDGLSRLCRSALLFSSEWKLGWGSNESEALPVMFHM